MTNDYNTLRRAHSSRLEIVFSALMLALLTFGLTGCGAPARPHSSASADWGGADFFAPGKFLAADPAGVTPSAPEPAKAPAAPQGPAAEQRKKAIDQNDDAPGEPGPFRYVLYGLVGFPRDVCAAVVEPVGYVTGVVGGIAFNIIVLLPSFGYYGEFRVERPLSRGCILAACLPVFIPSDIFFRSFTGDMDVYRFGVHPFPRAKHRFFPNFHAILRPGEDKEDE